MSGGPAPGPERSALLLIDLQNDFLDPSGAYARGGVGDPALDALAPRIAPLAEAARAAGVPVVASRFTLLPGRDGSPLVPAHLRELRPFLGGDDFRPGSWGHGVLDLLGPIDLAVDKVAYSAFAHTVLDWWLRRVGVDHLVVGGIVTNGGVASTVRDAHVRDYGVTVLTDGCAAFDHEAHEATLRSLSSVAGVLDIDEVRGAWAP